eukprot:13895615-Alexandrium_andersonii.AAC.1
MSASLVGSEMCIRDRPGPGECGGQRRTAWSRDRVASGLDYGSEASYCATERPYGPGKNGKPRSRDNWPGCVSGVEACAVSVRSVVLYADAESEMLVCSATFRVC